MAAIGRLPRSVLRSYSGLTMCRSSRRGVCGAVQAIMDVDISNLRDVEDLERQDDGRNPHWVFLGCPGVGKGTYASRLARLLDIPHIAMGDVIREELKSPSTSAVSKELSSAMTQGKLLPDKIIFELLSKRLELEKLAGKRGFILDGFPRTIRQAEVLEDVTDIDLVVNLKLREDALIAKCLGRRICDQCGANFNLAKVDIQDSDGQRIVMNPILPPPDCADKMTIRSDDTEEVVRTRLRVYHEQGAPVEGFYRLKGKLLDFDVGGGIPETWPKLLTALALRDKGHTRGLAQIVAA